MGSSSLPVQVFLPAPFGPAPGSALGAPMKVKGWKCEISFRSQQNDVLRQMTTPQNPEHDLQLPLGIRAISAWPACTALFFGL